MPSGWFGHVFQVLQVGKSFSLWHHYCYLIHHSMKTFWSTEVLKSVGLVESRHCRIRPKDLISELENYCAENLMHLRSLRLLK